MSVFYTNSERSCFLHVLNKMKLQDKTVLELLKLAGVANTATYQQYANKAQPENLGKKATNVPYSSDKLAIMVRELFIKEDFDVKGVKFEAIKEVETVNPIPNIGQSFFIQSATRVNPNPNVFFEDQVKSLP